MDSINSTIRLYADDVLIYRIIDSENDYNYDFTKRHWEIRTVGEHMVNEVQSWQMRSLKDNKQKDFP